MVVRGVRVGGHMIVFARRVAAGARWHACDWTGPMRWRAFCRAFEVINVYPTGGEPYDVTGEGRAVESAYRVEAGEVCRRCRRIAGWRAARLAAIAETDTGPVGPS